MAVFNEILAGRFNRSLQKLFSMKGPPPVPQLGSEVLPVHVFASGAENRYLEGWNLFGFQGTIVAGGAGTFAEEQLRNPVGSNVMAVFHKISCFPQNAGSLIQMSYGAITTDLATITPLSNTGFDSRPAQAPTLVYSNTTTAASANLANVFFDFNQNAQVDAVLYENQEIPLLPGFAIRAIAGVAVQNISIGWMWRERALEESERF